MKISTASKKVLASALSAAMVVAFAPTVAFGTPTGGATLTYVDKAGATKTASYDTVQKAVDEAAKANGTKTVVTLAGNATIDSDLDIAGVADGLTLDLAGNTLSISDDFYKQTVTPGGEYSQIIEIAGNKTGADSYTLGQYISGSKALIATSANTSAKDWKSFNGTLGSAGEVWTIDGTNYEVVVFANTTDEKAASGVAGYFTPVVKPGATVATGKVAIKNGTIDTIKAEKSYIGIEAGAELVLDGVKIAAEDGNKAVNSTAKVTVKGDSDISTKATNTTGTGSIVAIQSSDNVTVKAGKVTASDTGAKCAYAVQAYNVTIEGGEIVVNDDNDTANAYGYYPAAVYADRTAVTMSAGTVTANYTGSTKNAKGYAIYTTSGASNITGGAVNGALRLADYSISGGTFTADLKNTQKTLVASGYLAADNGTTSTVYKSAGFNVVANGTDDLLLATTYSTQTGLAASKVADAVMGNAAVGNTVAYTLGEGFTAEQVKAILTDSAKSALVRVAVSSSKFAAKDAKTDAQKAALAAASEAAAKTMDKVDTVYMLSAEIQYRAAGEREYATIATITDLGSSVSGRNTVANDVTLEGDTANGSKVFYLADGKLTEVELTKKSTQTYKHNNVTAMGIYAETSVDEDAIKDGISKPETPAEKATQSIDVAQKSKTVKLAGAKKTKKAVSFKLGASAETELTIAKKSGSSRISVSGQKVTLKKGTKKGTFTAKVSLKAAGSDEYLAAAKTITVKFVVKK